ncbi:MAG: discoidin domain-containing protein [Rhodobacter sp.]|nr:discoidin domain-containing protein [Rhodobacter sp.]
MARIQSNNTDVNLTTTFTSIEKLNIKDFDLYGNDNDNHVTLEGLNKQQTAVKDNPNITFHGYGGYDTLSYQEADVGVDMIVHDGESDFRLSGGHFRQQDSQYDFNSLDVYTRDVENIRLTSKSDTVDMTGWSGAFVVQVSLKGNSDSYIGHTFADYADGGDGADLLYGLEGNDTLIGGNGTDTIYGGTGDDLIDAGSAGNGSGTEWIEGGTGRDVIKSIASNGDSANAVIYGDIAFEEGQTPSAENEADLFIIGYDTSIAAAPDLGFAENFEEYADAAVDVGTAIVKLSPFGPLGGIAAKIGFSIGASALSNMISAGTAADAIDVSNNTKITIKDFDAWGDTLVIALDGEASAVSANVLFNADRTTIAEFDVGEYTFLATELATRQLSVINDDADVSEALISSLSADLLKNMLFNSMVVWDGEVLADTGNTDPITGEPIFESVYKMNARTLSGVDMVLSEAEQTRLEAALGEISNDGVWIMGDYGNSILFGHDLHLAGTASDNVMYSGAYILENNTSTWYSDTAVYMFGGAGNDVIFGSFAGADRLYGGTGDDYLVGVGNTANGNKLPDELYGGTGFDIASFEKVEYADDNGNTHQIGGYTSAADVQEGIFVNLGADSIAHQIDGTEWGDFVTGYESTGVVDAADRHEADVDGDGTNVGKTAANLHDIEGIVGSAKQDFLVGDAESNLLDGSGGNDYLIGSWGADTFRFTDTFGHDTVADFATLDTLVFSDVTSESAVVIDTTGPDPILWVGTNSVTLKGVDPNDLKMENIEYIGTGAGTWDAIVTLEGDRADDPSRLSDEEALLYLASHGDLIAAYGYNLTRAKNHYDNYGRAEGREITFNAEKYLSNYDDLQGAYGTDALRAAQHFVTNGYAEGRSENRYEDATVLSDLEAALYLASYGDLIQEFGYILAHAKAHYEAAGRAEGREITFDAAQYFENNPDVLAFYGNDPLKAAEHFVNSGFAEGRTDAANLTDSLSGSAATMSSVWDAPYAGFAVLDGQIGSVNHTAIGDASPWLSIDLGQDAWIDEIVIQNRQDRWFHQRLDGAELQVLDDGAVVDSVILGTGLTQTLDFGGVMGDEVRIEHSNGNYLHIAEIDVFGSFLL